MPVAATMRIHQERTNSRPLVFAEAAAVEALFKHQLFASKKLLQKRVVSLSRLGALKFIKHHEVSSTPYHTISSMQRAGATGCNRTKELRVSFFASG